MIAKQLKAHVEELEDEEKARLAAEILNLADSPDREFFLTFFASLDDTIHGELCTRGSQQEERNVGQEEE